MVFKEKDITFEPFFDFILSLPQVKLANLPPLLHSSKKKREISEPHKQNLHQRIKCRINYQITQQLNNLVKPMIYFYSYTNELKKYAKTI